jgi:hypothetical protein
LKSPIALWLLTEAPLQIDRKEADKGKQNGKDDAADLRLPCQTCVAKIVGDIFQEVVHDSNCCCKRYSQKWQVAVGKPRR